MLARSPPSGAPFAMTGAADEASQVAEEIESEALRQSERDTETWNQEWLAFPTVSRDAEGLWRYWDVPEDSGVYSQDWETGEGLARDTVAHMQSFHAGATVLRRIFKEMDYESTVGQGFLTRIEDMLTRPGLYLDSLEPGAVRAKLKALAEQA